MKTTRWVLVMMVVLAVAAPAAVDAKPQATCKAMCQRLTDCKLDSYAKQCLDVCKQYGYEATEQGRAQLLVLTQYTCKQVASAVGATDAHPPQPAPPRSSPPRSSPPPRAPSPSNPYDGDDADDDAPRPTAGGHDRGPRSYQAASGNDLGDSCASTCRRATECNVVPSAQRCGRFCASMASSGHPLRLGRASCAEIKKVFVTDEWMCWADGSTGSAYGNGPMTYGVKSIAANAKTRDEAAVKALRSCNALVGADQSLSNLSGATTDNGMCRVSRCLPPGSPLGPLL